MLGSRIGAWALLLEPEFWTVASGLTDEGAGQRWQRKGLCQEWCAVLDVPARPRHRPAAKRLIKRGWADWFLLRLMCISRYCGFLY